MFTKKLAFTLFAYMLQMVTIRIEARTMPAVDGDFRVNFYNLPTEKKEIASSIPLIIPKHYVKIDAVNKKLYLAIEFKTLAERMINYSKNVCNSTQPNYYKTPDVCDFYNEPVLMPGCGGGALVANDMILTAGHVITENAISQFPKDETNFYVIFGYYRGSAENNWTYQLNNPPLFNYLIMDYNPDNVYESAQILDHKCYELKLSTTSDYAVVKLNKKVLGRTPLRIARSITDFSTYDNTNRPNFYAYPQGLPLKVDLRSEWNGTYNLNSNILRMKCVDAFKGSSGGAYVAMQNDGYYYVVGIHFNGADPDIGCDNNQNAFIPNIESCLGNEAYANGTYDYRITQKVPKLPWEQTSWDYKTHPVKAPLGAPAISWQIIITGQVEPEQQPPKLPYGTGTDILQVYSCAKVQEKFWNVVLKPPQQLTGPVKIVRVCMKFRTAEECAAFTKDIDPIADDRPDADLIKSGDIAVKTTGAPNRFEPCGSAYNITGPFQFTAGAEYFNYETPVAQSVFQLPVFTFGTTPDCSLWHEMFYYQSVLISFIYQSKSYYILDNLSSKIPTSITANYLLFSTIRR